MNPVHEGLLEMLIDIDLAMRDAGIDYSLAYGTALGAIRHKGFIPWDDDADIFILEKDVPAFEDVMDRLSKQGKYSLQKPFSVDWCNSFYKIRLNNSTAIEPLHMHTRIHQGLFVDVFVMRGYPRSNLRRKMYNLQLFFQRGLRRLEYPSEGKPHLGFYQRIIFTLYRISLKICAGLCEPDSGYLFGDEPSGTIGVYPAEIFEKYRDIDYEGHQLRVVEDCDQYLSLFYGDYMEPPPENERIGEHLIAYDKNKDYSVWLDEYYREHPDEMPSYRKNRNNSNQYSE